MNETGGGAWDDASLRASSSGGGEANPGSWSDGGASRAGFGRAGNDVAPMSAEVCGRCIAGLSSPGADEA